MIMYLFPPFDDYRCSGGHDIYGPVWYDIGTERHKDKDIGIMVDANDGCFVVDTFYDTMIEVVVRG